MSEPFLYVELALYQAGPEFRDSFVSASPVLVLNVNSVMPHAVCTLLSHLPSSNPSNF